MSIFKWSLEHKARRVEVQTAVEGLGFKESEDDADIFVTKIAAGTYWREMKVRLRPEEVVVFVHKEEESTTETYFEYLMHAGFLAGKLASRIELLDVKGDEEEVPEDDYDPDEDDQELAGEEN